MDEFMSQFANIVMNNLQYVLLGITILILLALIIFININLKLSKMNRRYEKMMEGMEGSNLEKLLLDHIAEVHQALAEVDKLSKECRRLDGISKHTVQKLGIIRFNAFEDTGSDLSYAVALLDANDNGVVMSSIFGRNESRVYAKPIVNGQSTYFLTEEEKQALTQAQNYGSK